MMSGAGALMGIGRARGDNRAVSAAELAISRPLLEAAWTARTACCCRSRAGAPTSACSRSTRPPAGGRLGPSRGQHHLRRGHRRRARRRGAGDGDRGRVRRRVAQAKPVEAPRKEQPPATGQAGPAAAVLDHATVTSRYGPPATSGRGALRVRGGNGGHVRRPVELDEELDVPDFLRGEGSGGCDVPLRRGVAGSVRRPQPGRARRRRPGRVGGRPAAAGGGPAASADWVEQIQRRTVQVVDAPRRAGRGDRRAVPPDRGRGRRRPTACRSCFDQAAGVTAAAHAGGWHGRRRRRRWRCSRRGHHAPLAASAAPATRSRRTCRPRSSPGCPAATSRTRAGRRGCGRVRARQLARPSAWPARHRAAPHRRGRRALRPPRRRQPAAQAGRLDGAATGAGRSRRLRSAGRGAESPAGRRSGRGSRRPAKAAGAATRAR